MRILVTGGGTGGHIYPALSLIKEIKKENPKAEFLYVGTQNGLESQIVPAANIPFETIDIQGIKRSISIENIKTMYLFFKGLRESKKILKNFQPDIVLGTGGYVCGPVVYQASKMGIPTIIHEQNSVPGITNKFLSRYVKKVCVCFPEAISYFPTEKVVLTGNPRAQEVAGIPKSAVFSQFSLDPEKKTVVIFGGSRGAKTINEAFLDAFNEFEDKNYQVLYISGKYYYPQVMERMKTLKNLTNISVQEYVNNMEEILVNTSLVVGRAGATSIAEITSLGIPAILIPSPNVTNDHQTKNAQSLVNVGAAILIKDNELNGKVLVQEIDKIMNADSLREKMSQSSKEQGLPHAADTIYQLMLDIQN